MRGALGMHNLYVHLELLYEPGFKSFPTLIKYKHCVNKSRYMSRDHLAKNRQLLTNWWPV